jgi:hypothetical protein
MEKLASNEASRIEKSYRAGELTFWTLMIELVAACRHVAPDNLLRQLPNDIIQTFLAWLRSYDVENTVWVGGEMTEPPVSKEEMARLKEWAARLPLALTFGMKGSEVHW